MQQLKSGLLHTAWADDLLFSKLLECPEDALDYTYAAADWPVARIAAHIVDGAEWYKYVLTGVRWNEVTIPKAISDLKPLQVQLRELHKIWLDQVELPDELIEFEDENGMRTVMRSTVLNQIAYHSTEHRAQIFVALEKNGFNKIKADDFDVWAWEAYLK